MNISNDTGKAVIQTDGVYYYASDLGSEKFWQYGVALRFPEEEHVPNKTLEIDYAVKVSEKMSLVIDADNVERIVTMDVDDAAYRSLAMDQEWFRAYRDTEVASQMSLDSKHSCSSQCDTYNNKMILERQRDIAAYQLKYSKAKWYKRLFMFKL
jgi:hypothetical protein